MPIVVSDTSPLRALAHLNRLDLLQALFGEVFVPPAVIAELQFPRRRFPSFDLTQFSYFRVRAPTDQALVVDLMSQLDVGEAEAIALAIELQAQALLIDEVSGRNEAKRRGLHVTGVLGILREAKVVGLVTVVKPLIDELVHGQGFFLLSSLRDQILRDCGEVP